MTAPEPFYASGISFGKQSDFSSDIAELDNAITINSDGELVFTDDWIKKQVDINGDPISSVTLRELWLKNNGVFAKDGKLYFRDSSVTRAYSLSEILSSFLETKNKMVSGGLYWIGRTKITGEECHNVKVDVNGNPALGPNILPVGNTPGSRVYDANLTTAPGTKVFSLDYYFATESFTPSISSQPNGDLRWHDVPNLKIVLPQLDNNKAASILAKVSVRLAEAPSPILFRLYNETTGEELDKVAISGISDGMIETQPTLSFTGTIRPYDEAYPKISCDCPSTERKINSDVEPNHIIKVQFYTNVHYTTSTVNYRANERRTIGVPNSLTNAPINNSSIDVSIYDISKYDRIGRKSGTANFDTMESFDIEFDKPFVDSSYSISISCNKNINMYYTNKTKNGFTIKSEKKFSGEVDWVATKL